MHELIKCHLEDFLRGGSKKKIPLEFNAHLRECEGCRESVIEMQDQSLVLRALAAPAGIDPAPGFYGRLVDRIETQQNTSIWNIFLDPVFGRRLVAASAMMACLLCGYLAFTETHPSQQANNAEAIMAVQEHPEDSAIDQQNDRDTVLVTLASYQDSGQ